MKRDGLLNPAILQSVAALGHTEYFAIGDCGLPVPKDVKVIDVSVTAGIPRFSEVLRTVCSELVFECVIMAEEIQKANPETLKQIREITGDVPSTFISHEEFKKLLPRCKCVIRTGETTSYANIILVGGVNF